MATEKPKEATPEQKPPQQTNQSMQSRLEPTLAGMLARVDVKKRFEELLKDKAPGFISSILSVVNANPMLRTADPKSIISAASIAASMDLPINSNLGFAHIVPYRDHGGQAIAQFQMGWKGFVQLAIRTGLYKTINATEIYEGELVSYDRLSGDTTIDETQRKSDKIVGYIAYIKLMPGFEKTLYMTVDQVRRHAQKYSKSYSKPGTPWQVNFDAMALKTVVKLLLSKWGVLSVEMQKALQVDQGVAVVDAGGEKLAFMDNPDENAIEAEAVAEAIPQPIQSPATAHVKAEELFGAKE